MLEFPSVRIAFVRHGQARASDGSYDRHTPLSALGLRQAERIARAFSALDAAPRGIFTSPYPRCVETAAPLCAALGASARVDERLCEFEMEPRSLADLQLRPDLALWEGTHRGSTDGESLAEFSQRVSRCVENIIEQHLGSSIIVFTHSGVIDAAFRWLVGLPHASAWLHDLPLANASITEVEYWPRGRTEGGAPRYTAVLRVGDTRHLADCGSET